MRDQRQCGRCGSARTRVIAQSVSPPGEFVQCQDCGHSTLVPSDAANVTSKPVAGDVDARRIERLVNTFIDARCLPLRVLSVARAPGGWRITVRPEMGDFVTFDVPADSIAVMRAAIERALATEAS